MLFLDWVYHDNKWSYMRCCRRHLKRSRGNHHHLRETKEEIRILSPQKFQPIKQQNPVAYEPTHLFLEYLQITDKKEEEPSGSYNRSFKASTCSHIDDRILQPSFSAVYVMSSPNCSGNSASNEIRNRFWKEHQLGRLGHYFSYFFCGAGKETKKGDFAGDITTIAVFSQTPAKTQNREHQNPLTIHLRHPPFLPLDKRRARHSHQSLSRSWRLPRPKSPSQIRSPPRRLCSKPASRKSSTRNSVEPC